jgi:site-specific DNA-methyltransferase (adenine-specific)
MATLVRLWAGDCLERLQELEDASVFLFLMDPPYDLTSGNGKGGFMGKEWDSTGIAFSSDFWTLVFRKLHPNGVVKSFGATRTYHRMVRAMRSAGFEVRSLHPFVHGQGFPKSTNISKRIDRKAKAERQIVGYTRGVGGESMNDVVRGRGKVRSRAKAGGALGAYGTGAKQVAVAVPVTLPSTKEAKLWHGYGTACKPSWEPIAIARKRP